MSERIDPAKKAKAIKYIREGCNFDYIVNAVGLNKKQLYKISGDLKGGIDRDALRRTRAEQQRKDRERLRAEQRRRESTVVMIDGEPHCTICPGKPKLTKTHCIACRTREHLKLNGANP